MISILMATYNGEKYICEQIDSLFAQTVQDFTLYVSDDKSADRTCEIIEHYTRRYPGRIVLCRRQSNSGGAQNNFLDLMTAHKDDYVMLCDQEDRISLAKFDGDDADENLTAAQKYLAELVDELNGGAQ